jgi:hypothetical protein
MHGQRGQVVSLGLVGAGVAVIAWHRSGQISVVALALATVAAAYVSPALERWLKRRWLFRTLIVAISTAVVYALIGSTLGAGWSPIDDHEIMGFLGSEGRVRVLEIPSLLMQTEAGRPGTSFPRYRPSYYTVRLIETTLWGASPRAWYASHLAMFTASVAFAWRFFARWIGVVPGGMLVLYMLTYGDLWADIWSHLGPSEAYCVLGTALYLEGMAEVARPRQASWVPSGWALVGVGGWLAMGSKENFSVMLVPLWVLAALLWRRGQLGRAGTMTLVFLTAYGGLIASSVTISLIHTGADVYGKPVTAAGRLPLLRAGFERAIAPLLWWHVVVALILAAAVGALMVRGSSRRRYGPLVRGVYLTCGLVALYVSQFAFYNGEWPAPIAAPRYAFPGVLTRPLLVVTAAVVGLELLKRLRIPRDVVRAVGAGLVAVLLIFTLDTGWASLKEATQASVLATREWTSRLERVVARLQRDPTRAVVVVSHDISDYEPIFAIPRFLTANGVKNPMYLVTPLYRTDTPLTADLARTLYGVSQFGYSGYAPLDRLPASPIPFAVGLSGPPPTGYENVGSLWPMRATIALK